MGHNQPHNFSDMLVIAILATLCGADNWVEMEAFASSKRDWLSSFLQLPGGIPSHDTFEPADKPHASGGDVLKQ